MTLDELRALLAAPEAWRGHEAALDALAPQDRGRFLAAHARMQRERVAYCDERARTIAQALEADAAVQRDRDAAVRALLRAVDAETGVATALAALKALYPVPDYVEGRDCPYCERRGEGTHQYCEDDAQEGK